MEIKPKRSLGFIAAYSASVGLVVSGTAMVSLGNGFGTAGLSFIIPAFLGLVIILMITFSYSELAALMPGGGMVGEYAQPALGRLAAIFAVFAGYLVLVAADGGTQMVIAGQSMELLTGVPSAVFSWLILIAIVAVNIAGVDMFARIQIPLAIGLMLLLGVLGLLGGLGVGGQERVDNPFFAAEIGVLASMGAVSIWLYIGMEFVAPLAEEIKRPWRNIPLGMSLGVVSIFLVDMLFGWGATQFVDLGLMAGSSTPHVVGSEAMFGEFGRVLMVWVTVVAALGTANSHLAAIPRMLYGLANSGLLPKVVGRLHPRTRVPWVATLIVAALVAIVLLYTTFMEAGIELILSLISVACVTWLFSYIIAQVSVIMLRRKYPLANRPYKTPLYPVPQIIGIVACVYLIVFIVPDFEQRLVIWGAALGLSVLIVLFGAWWLRKAGLPLFKPTELTATQRNITVRSEQGE